MDGRNHFIGRLYHCDDELDSLPQEDVVRAVGPFFQLLCYKTQAFDTQNTELIP